MCCCSKAGRKTYKAYQQRQMVEQARSSAYGTTLQPEQYNHGYSPDSLSIKANAEITEKDGLEPPAYSDVVGEHAVINDQATSGGQSGSSSTSSEYTPSEGRYKSKWQLKLAEKRAKYEAKQQQRQEEFERKLEERAAKYQQKLEKRAMKGF
ncbi:hypothetical protein KC343_g5451 [Hortaea werneckii]|nr:hypothetical protein KC352_g20733 [Hortaea werneckii]KAI7557804.1 hypothetical protein KC317_g11400 [Hortaea werneckii]KAI7605165.1 hypothetical protein KC346_g11147 [Hortaea werneckii]KAI7629054.1 hypothetical protein KC343_g5451 [Hortaea werneckii]KAI7642272.1 hypothetical protein KC319_g13116 [Hortaea werneckii]